MEKIIVWGLPRSGTSLAAALVRHFGVDFKDADERYELSNPSGILENADIMRLNTSIQFDYDSSLFTPTIIPKTEKYRKIIQETVADIEGFKMTRLVPHLYEDALNVKWVLVERNLEDWLDAVLFYGKNLNRKDMEEMAFMYSVVRDSLKSPSIRINFDDMINHMDWVGRRMARFLDKPNPQDFNSLIKPRWSR